MLRYLTGNSLRWSYTDRGRRSGRARRSNHMTSWHRATSALHDHSGWTNRWSLHAGLRLRSADKNITRRQRLVRVN
jgi:hypothetical protein